MEWVQQVARFGGPPAENDLRRRQAEDAEANRRLQRDHAVPCAARNEQRVTGFHTSVQAMRLRKYLPLPGQGIEARNVDVAQLRAPIVLALPAHVLPLIGRAQND